MHIRLSFGQLSTLPLLSWASGTMTSGISAPGLGSLSSARLGSAWLSSGAVRHHNPNETRLINELLISFATTRRHIHIMLSFASPHSPTPPLSLSLSKQLQQRSLRLGSCNIILLCRYSGAGKRKSSTTSSPSPCSLYPSLPLSPSLTPSECVFLPLPSVSCNPISSWTMCASVCVCVCSCV